MNSSQNGVTTGDFAKVKNSFKLSAELAIKRSAGKENSTKTANTAAPAKAPKANSVPSRTKMANAKVTKRKVTN